MTKEGEPCITVDMSWNMGCQGQSDQAIKLFQITP